MLVAQNMSVPDELDMLVPTKKPGAPEQQAQIAVVSYLRSALPAGSIVAAVKNENHARSKSRGAQMRFQQKRKETGVKPGFPDLICLIPGGKTVLIEMKAPKRGRLSPAQVECHAALRSLGHVVGVARSIDEAQLILEQAGISLRART